MILSSLHDPNTIPADALALIHPGVFRSAKMPATAMGSYCFSSAMVVHSASDWLKMTWPYTSGSSTEMVEYEAIRNDPINQHISKAVGKHGRSTILHSELPVALPLESSPKPASISKFDPRPEPKVGRAMKRTRKSSRMTEHRKRLLSVSRLGLLSAAPRLLFALNSTTPGYWGNLEGMG